MDGTEPYHVPTVLTVFASIFLILGAICFVIVCADIVWRRGWKSMMAIMIPVWPINAAYLGPFLLFLYFKYGRPAVPSLSGEAHDHTKLQHDQEDMPDHHSHVHAAMDHDHSAMNHDHAAMNHDHSATNHDHAAMNHDHAAMNHLNASSEKAEEQSKRDPEKGGHEKSQMSHSHMHHMGGGDRPEWVTVLVGVSHCGAGCVLGDIVGEWLVYGTGATINGQGIWVELLVDYAFALLFGIIFQYFSIAPMSGDYGWKSVVRAVKADILSLTSFEIGLFGWMVAYQVGIWDYRLEMTTYTYWWMMQVGMVFGFATAVPVNWWLIKKEIKEPCA